MIIGNRSFYQKAGEAIKIGFFKETVESDFAKMERIVLPATLKDIQRIKQNYMEKYLRYYVRRRLKQFAEKKPTIDVSTIDDTLG